MKSMKKITLLLMLFSISCFVFPQQYEEISIAKLPKGVKDYVTQNFKNVKIIRAAQSVQNNEKIYGAVIEADGRKYSMIFDKNGTFIQKADDLLKSLAPSGKTGSMGGSSGGTTGGLTGGPANPKRTIRPLPLMSCPKGVQDYIAKNYPKATVISSGQYTEKGQGFFVVTVSEKGKDYTFHFTSQGQNMPNRTQITPASARTGK